MMGIRGLRNRREFALDQFLVNFKFGLDPSEHMEAEG